MILVRIDGIKGDVQIAGYKDWFVAESVSFGVGRKIEASKKGGDRDIETGKGDSQEISIDKSIDTASVDLMYTAMRDRTEAGPPKLVSVDIHFIETHTRAESGEKADAKAYLKISLGKALVKNWSISGSEDGRPTESISIWFNQAAMKYRASRDGKTFQTYGPKGWDQQGHCDWKPSGMES